MRRGYEVNGLRIAQLRTERLKQISQADFARRCGLHWVTMSNIENGKARVSLETLETIAGELGVRRDDLLSRPEDQALSADEDDESSVATAFAQLFERAIDSAVERRLTKEQS
jgi:transcriptional regulator with XRE-family HTH domain